jgi:hypothetical protein
VTLRRMTLAALVVLAIGSVALSPSRDPETGIDPAAGLNVKRAVPAPVMSTLRRACFDCHSNETRWPWYSSLPGVSWAIARDVHAGRGQLNFSRWTEYNRFDRASMLDEVCEMVTAGKMPLRPYRLLHPEARLSDTDVAELCAWTRLEATHLVEGGS